MSKEVNYIYEVRVSDINYGGHMGNDKALTVFHDARINFLQSFGFSEMNIGDNIGIILIEANIKYKAEVFLHDVLEVSVKLDKVEGIKWNLAYTAKRSSDSKVVFEGNTLMASFNYERKKISPIPRAFLDKVMS